MKAVLNYIAARELWHAKRHLAVMRHAVQPCNCTIFYFIRPHLALILFNVFYFNHAIGSSAIPQACYNSNSRCYLFLASLETNSYYWLGVLIPARQIKDIIKLWLIFNDVITLIFISLYIVGHYVI